MKSNLLRLSLLPLAAGMALPAFAQSRDDDVPVQFAQVRNWTFALGVRANSSGATVKFGNLGTIPSIRSIGAADTLRTYDNGGVAPDAKRTNETYDDVTSLTAVTDPNDPNRFIVRTLITAADPNSGYKDVGNQLKYQAGLTRNWGYNYPSQVSADGKSIAFNTYSAISDGASATADSGNSAGLDLQLGRIFGKLSDRVEWGVSLSVGISDINAKTSGTIKSTLKTLTDLHSLNGAAAPAAPYAGPSSADFTAPDGTVYTQALETTTPLSTTAIRSESAVAGGATVEGNWQIKGAYYMVRFGPTIRYSFTERLAVSASIGVAEAYVGTKYKVDERLVISEVDSTIGIRDENRNEERKFITGFYGELNAEFWVTERTGFYAGVTYENLGDYEQTLGSRTATVELGSGAGVRLGITTRF